ncbi:MAG: response regulator transcription factor [Lachnospiraceae bacterium]
MIKIPYDKKILIVDDDESILLMIETVLRKEGYKNIYKASCGEDAIKSAYTVSPDLILLDVMLPDMDGYEVCKNIRLQSMTPILFISAKSDEVDKLLSYAMGGDEYITKPFSPKELIAKIKAVLVRQQYYENKMQEKKTYSFGRFVLDMNKMILLCDGHSVPLTAKEYALLEYLIQNKNITMSKEKILENVWNVDYDGYDNTVMVHIRHLREKIEDDPSNPVYLKTVKGRGYMFEENEQKEM